MMSLVVVNYPGFSEQDFEWIQSVRKQHDPLFFDVIDPHFTMVFPTSNIDEQTLIEHTRQHASTFPAFDVVFRCAVVGDPNFMDHAHAFLVPDEGFSNVVRLHDLLYTGPLESELRLDLPFTPHVAFANTPTPAECKAIIDELNAENFEMRARVQALDVIRYEGGRVSPVERVELA
jgi:hypothetical protein